MQDESLKIARTILIERIINSNINQQDKVELMINLHHFLQPNEYEKNKKVLNKERGK